MSDEATHMNGNTPEEHASTHPVKAVQALIERRRHDVQHNCLHGTPLPRVADEELAAFVTETNVIAASSALKLAGYMPSHNIASELYPAHDGIHARLLDGLPDLVTTITNPAPGWAGDTLRDLVIFWMTEVSNRLLIQIANQVMAEIADRPKLAATMGVSPAE